MAALLLLQFRLDEVVAQQETQCFLDAGQLAPEDVRSINLARSPQLDWSDVERFRALVVGGAGVFSSTTNNDFSSGLRDVLKRWVDGGRPFFGSCYGHHVLAQVTGGTVETDQSREEIGSFNIELTEAGQQDELFGKSPARFVGQLGHHDYVSRLGPGVVELASTSRCRNQAIRVAGKPAFGTQFHPELSKEDIRARLLMYESEYLNHDSHKETIDQLQPSPEAVSIFRRFVELAAC